MTKLTKAQLAARKRLLDDFEFYAKHAVKIRTKSGEVAPLILNRVQKRFLSQLLGQVATTGKIRFVILKGRQQGLSTIVSAFIYWWISQRKGQKGIVIAHVKDSTDTLFGMYKRIHENLPDMLRPEKKYSNKRELVFSTLDSGMMVATAGGDSIARGETLQCMHLSEVAFWPKTFAKENFNGLIQALPDIPGTCCFVESTANGITGQFHDLWQGAVAGHSGFEPFFSAWYESDEYREDPPETFEATPDERELAKAYGLDDAQLYWRRRKIATNGIELFKQEYPCTADEAFITSGRPVFHIETIVEMKDKAKAPIKRMAVEPGADGTLSVVEHPRGELLVYHERVDSENYVIGADTGIGVKNPEKADFCVAQVLDSKKRQVAVWRGQPTPEHYARVLNALGLYYNIALVAPERNAHGIWVCVRLWKDLAYPNCFLDVKEGETVDKETCNIGFYTSVSSKPLIIDKLRGAVSTRQIELQDQTTLSEMLSFIFTESGKMEGEQGCCDDAVMSLAIANHCCESMFTPIEVTDDYYTRAI